MYGMLAQSFGAMGVGVMKSRIGYDIAEMGCSAQEQFGKRRVIGYYSDMLVYANLYLDADADRRYGERVMLVSVKDIHKHAVYICDEVKNSIAKSHLAWIVPALFNPLLYINDPRYLEGDWTPWIARKVNGRKANMEFMLNNILEC